MGVVAAGTPGYVDYTVDIANVVTQLGALTTAVNLLATELSMTNTLLGNSNNIQNTVSTNVLAISTTLTDLDAQVTAIKTALTDPTIGINTKQVDLPYQGIYQRAMTRMSLTDGNLVTSMQRAVQEEKVSPIFTTGA